MYLQVNKSNIKTSVLQHIFTPRPIGEVIHASADGKVDFFVKTPPIPYLSLLNILISKCEIN